MSDFQREDRYVVVKLSRLSPAEQDDLRSFIADEDLPTEECVVVESDWPNYEDTWKAVQQVEAGMYEPGEKERLQSELTAARDEAERLRGRCGELEADANRFKFIARRESHQSMAMVNHEIACISGENPTEDQFREAVDEAMESAQRMSPQGAAPDMGGEK